MAINMDRHNLALTFGILGNIISFLVYLAPLPTFYRIYKKKSTEGFQSLPYLVALFSSVLWLYYGLLKTDATLLLTINSFGCVVEIIYIFMYIIYATKDAKSLTIKLFMAMNVVCFSLIVFITQFALHGSHRVIVLGWICVAISVSVFAAPLSIVAQVIRTKSVEFMPFNLSLFLTLSAIMWFAYGAFLRDICIAIPNVLGFALGLIQMVLYGIYKEKGVSVKKEQISLEPMRNVVVVSPLGTKEVFPIPIIEHDDHDHDHDDVKEEEGKKELGAEENKEKSVQDNECIV